MTSGPPEESALAFPQEAQPLSQQVRPCDLSNRLKGHFFREGAERCECGQVEVPKLPTVEFPDAGQQATSREKTTEHENHTRVDGQR